MSVKRDVWRRISEHAEQFGALFEELGHARDDGMSRAGVEGMRKDILHCLSRARGDVFTHTRPYTWTPSGSDRGCLTLRVLSEVVSAVPNLLFNPTANVQWRKWDRYLTETRSGVVGAGISVASAKNIGDEVRSVVTDPGLFFTNRIKHQNDVPHLFKGTGGFFYWTKRTL